MKLKLTANVGGAVKTFETMAESLADLTGPLRRLDKFIRLKTQRRFDSSGPGWPALQQRTTATRMRNKIGALGRKLEKEVQRAEKTAKTARSVENRKNVLAEFRRLEAGGALERSLLSPKQSGKLQQRIDRAKAKASKPLGRLASSIKSEVSRGRLRVFSEVEWSGVHNEGGAAGNGAKIPKREFLIVDDEDIEALQGFISDAIEGKAEE